MMKPGVTVLALLLLLMPAILNSELLTPIQLTASQEIADIEELDAAMGNLTTKMKQCAASGLAPLPECHCRYPQKLEVTKTALTRVLSKYPQWENRALLWWNTSGTVPSNLHMGGIDTRIGQPCRQTELSMINPEAIEPSIAPAVGLQTFPFSFQ